MPQLLARHAEVETVPFKLLFEFGEVRRIAEGRLRGSQHSSHVFQTITSKNKQYTFIGPGASRLATLDKTCECGCRRGFDEDPRGARQFSYGRENFIVRYG